MLTAAPLTRTPPAGPPNEAEPQTRVAPAQLRAPATTERSGDQFAAAVRHCVEDHARALLGVLAQAGSGWDATDDERRTLAELVAGQLTRPTAPTTARNEDLLPTEEPLPG